MKDCSGNTQNIWWGKIHRWEAWDVLNYETVREKQDVIGKKWIQNDKDTLRKLLNVGNTWDKRDTSCWCYLRDQITVWKIKQSKTCEGLFQKCSYDVGYMVTTKLHKQLYSMTGTSVVIINYYKGKRKPRKEIIEDSSFWNQVMKVTERIIVQ